MNVPTRTRKNTNVPEAQQLGSRLRDLRKVAGISLRDMAERLHAQKARSPMLKPVP